MAKVCKNKNYSIKLISFDLDGTLVDKNSFDKIFWEEEVPKLYAAKKGMSIEEAKKKVKEHYYGVPPTSTEWYRPSYWFRFFDLKEDHNKVLNDLKHKIKIYPDVIPALKELKIINEHNRKKEDYRNKRGMVAKFKMIVLTHSTRDMIGFKLEAENLKRYFDDVISTTDDLEMIKKDSKIYDLVLKKYNIKCDEMLHVGDDEEFDYNVPKKKGIKTLLIDRKCVTATRSKNAEEDKRDKEVIYSLADLKKYIQ
jgi:HAD superfamily hydrolase (TIGR01549 family)